MPALSTGHVKYALLLAPWGHYHPLGCATVRRLDTRDIDWRSRQLVFRDI